jgi:biotin carboxylase
VSSSRPHTILCVASYFKGNRFLQQAKREGAHVVLLTAESILGEPWVRESIDEVFALPSFKDRQAVLNAVSYLARTRDFDRIAPLDDFDVELVALLREHLRIPGMGETTARYFRDKLAMRARAQDRGVRIPDFVHVLNHDRIRRFTETVAPPWMLKPRSEASSVGIKKIADSDTLWRAIHELGDAQSNYLLERMVPGDVYHVDGIVAERELVFAEASKYRTPIFNVTQEGGIFATRTVPRDSTESAALIELTRELVGHLGLVRGVTHTEFIKSRDDGKFYFLETAARVGGANIADMIEAATGLNLWEEWARIEVSQGEQPYALPKHRREYAGLIVSLSRQEHPNTSAYNDPEVAWRMTEKKHHVGLVVRAETPERVEQLIESYVPRILADFTATLPPPEKATA